MNEFWTSENAPLISAIAASVSVFLSILAFFRPEIVTFFQKRKSLLDFHPRPGSKLIVAFRDAPILWIDGTLESIVGNNLISDASLTIIRNIDGARYDFQWVNWESTQSANQNSSPAYAFLLYQNTTINGLFAFRDEVRKTRYKDALDNVAEKFIAYWNAKYPLPQPYPEDKKPDFDDFFKGSQDALDCLSQVQKAIYWEADKYTAKMKVCTKRPNKQHEFTFEFELSQSDHDYIYQGAIKTLCSSCGINNVLFHQVYKEIQNFIKT